MNLQEIAIQTATRFVASQLLRIGEPVSLTIEKDGELGRGEYMRKPHPIELMLKAERAGKPLESVFDQGAPAAKVKESIERYRIERRPFIGSLIYERLSISAASSAAMGGRMPVPQSDFERARELALEIDPSADPVQRLEHFYDFAISLFQPNVFEIISFVARELAENRTVKGEALKGLWRRAIANVEGESAPAAEAARQPVGVRVPAEKLTGPWSVAGSNKAA